MSDAILSLEESIEKHESAFLTQMQNMVYRDAHGEQGDFPILEIASTDFYRYSSYERALAARTRDLLVNPVLLDLFHLHGHRTRQIELINYPRRRNEQFEKAAGVELVVDTTEGRIGIRYVDFTPPDHVLLDVATKFQLDIVLIVDWSDRQRTRRPDGLAVSKDAPFTIGYVTVRDLFLRFFSEAEYEIFLTGMRGAVSKANDIIGMGAVARLTMSRIASLRGEILDGLKTERDTGEAHCFASGETPNKPFGALSTEDSAALDRAYYDNGLCYALVGSSEFARCFVTAEYLRRAFAQGGAFDYTSIACGYLKAIEQLAYALMKYRLSSGNLDDLFIKKKPGKGPAVGETVKKQPFGLRKSDHVIFTPENETCFDTSLGSLANFLNDDSTAWRLSKDGRHYVLWALRQYAKDCRNGHFHKDNIDSLEEVERIRKNTLHVARLLLGGYTGTGSGISLSEWLGIDADAIEYDRLFALMEGMPRSCRRFKLKFAGCEPQYVERPFDRPLIEYDDSGHIVTPLLFATAGTRDAPTADSPNLEDCDLRVARANMPEHIWSIRADGEELPLQ